MDSSPGEDRLLQVVDAFGSPLVRHGPELVEDRSGGRVDQIGADRELDDGPFALGDADEPRRVGPAELVQTDPVHPGDLVGIRVEHGVGAAPKDKGRDHIP